MAIRQLSFITSPANTIQLADRLKVILRYYGISPWEIEVIHGILSSHFEIIQDEVEPDEEDYVSVLEVRIPLAFNSAFFEWITFKKWERTKAIFKEMRRRRGSGNALKIVLGFAGSPGITFVVATNDKQLFENAVEKVDFVVELLKYHEESLPPDIAEIRYVFDSGTARWSRAEALGEKKYSFLGDGWTEKEG